MYRHAAGQLVAQLGNDSFVERVESEMNIVERLLQPLKDDLFDTLIVCTAFVFCLCSGIHMYTCMFVCV